MKKNTRYDRFAAVLRFSVMIAIAASPLSLVTQAGPRHEQETNVANADNGSRIFRTGFLTDDNMKDNATTKKLADCAFGVKVRHQWFKLTKHFRTHHSREPIFAEDPLVLREEYYEPDSMVQWFQAFGIELSLRREVIREFLSVGITTGLYVPQDLFIIRQSIPDREELEEMGEFTSPSEFYLSLGLDSVFISTRVTRVPVGVSIDFQPIQGLALQFGGGAYLSTYVTSEEHIDSIETGDGGPYGVLKRGDVEIYTFTDRFFQILPYVGIGASYVLATGPIVFEIGGNVSFSRRDMLQEYRYQGPVASSYDREDTENQTLKSGIESHPVSFGLHASLNL